MEFALECGFREMVVEGDNLSVMSALELKKSLSSRVGHIIQDVLCLPNGFRWSQVQFTKRSANTAPHLLARYAKQVSHDVIWTEESLDLYCEKLLVHSEVPLMWSPPALASQIKKCHAAIFLINLHISTYLLA